MASFESQLRSPGSPRAPTASGLSGICFLWVEMECERREDVSPPYERQQVRCLEDLELRCGDPVGEPTAGRRSEHDIARAVPQQHGNGDGREIERPRGDHCAHVMFDT